MPDERDDAAENEEVQEAQRTLAAIPEYDWLTRSTQPWFSVSEIAPQMGVSKEAVRGWCERGEIQHATLYTQQVGWRMPRSGLLMFFAARVRAGEQRDGQQSAG